MCGIVGFWGGGRAGDEGSAVVRAMADAIVTRGPDSAGYWHESEHGLWLGHRRLAIVDLSASGHQPMVSHSGRYTLVYNGEAYNHVQVRAALASSGQAPAWRGHSDTETILAGFDAWGIAATIERLSGMFAFAVWDRASASLTLGRDRLGEKPLYYGWQGPQGASVFMFGSELKALRAHPSFENRVDRAALSALLQYNCIPAPQSIYQGIAKVEAGTLLTLTPGARVPSIHTYWSGAQVAQAGAAAPFAGTPGQAVDRLEQLLLDAVAQQMVADVPLGAFLSGGVDSSTIVALMQAQSARPVKTFTIGFHEAGFNEAEHAKDVARHLGTEHTEAYVSAAEALDVVPGLPSLYDEPFADSSQIPTFLLSKLARQHVTVSLSGDGGDELFCGYSRYRQASKLWGKLRAFPLPLRALAARGLAGVGTGSWDRIAAALQPLLPARAGVSHPGDRMHKAARLLSSPDVQALYSSMMTHFQHPEDVVIGGAQPSARFAGGIAGFSGLDEVQGMMALDMLTYLPDDILVKVDRASMGVSLESRVPLLDHRVVEFAWTLPQAMKLHGGQTKWALREVLHRYVPREMIERPKMGFGVPIAAWLRGPLRPWAEALLDESRLRQEGFFHAAAVRSKWEEHVSGQRDWKYHLWGVLMFQAWLEVQ